MIWYIIAAIAFGIAVAILVVSRLRDRRYLRLLASQTIRPAVREELEEELATARGRHEKFRGALAEAEKEGGGNP